MGRARAWAAALALAVLLWPSATVRAQQAEQGEAAPEQEAPEPAPAEGSEAAEGQEPGASADLAAPIRWEWQQVLSAPRIGGRLRSVAVDPQNPNRIFVGTGEGTVLRSTDGGVTWRELELSPFVRERRTTRPRTPGLPRLGTRPAENLSLFVDPPYRPTPTDRSVTALPLNTAWFSIRPQFIWLGFIPTIPPPSQTLLSDTTRSHPTTSVRRIAICPGAEYPLLIGTRNEVLGSQDDGLTYVRLLRVPGNIQVRWVECDESDPSDVMVATDFGMFRSTDGGVTFDQDLSGWPGRSTTAVAYGARLPEGGKRLFVATGDVMFVGDPESEEGLVMRYPDFDNVETAPWTTINWVETTGEAVWLGTNEGVRSSSDGGRSWENVAPNLFGRHVVSQVETGTNAGGGQRISVIAKDCQRPTRCRASMIYATDDGGRTWQPFFQGATRRTVEQMAAAPAAEGTPPRWWVVTGGELWATVAPGLRRLPQVDREAQRWAARKLRGTPPMHVVVEDILARLELNAEDIEDATGAIADRNLVPLIHFELSADIPEGASARSEVFTPLGFERRTDRVEYTAWVYATWVFPDANLVREELAPRRNELYELRRQVAFIAEDAWHERRLHLDRIARGMSDPLQVAILQERITALEAVLETWMGHPIDERTR